MTVKVYAAAAFSKSGAGGNKAGVVLFHEGLTEAVKKETARRMGYSETVFVTKGGKADFKLAYFTPAEEVPLCGHATIAAFWLMRGFGMLDKSEYAIETGAGVLSVSLRGGKVFMEQGKPRFFEVLEKPAVAGCFDMDCVHPEHPIQIVSTGLRDILLPVKDEETLNAMRPDFDRITEISRKYDVVGIHAFAAHGERIICRNFAPLYDIPEEAATGTANCALAGYLYERNLSRKNEYAIEQGQSLGAPSEITVKIIGGGAGVSSVFVGGEGYFVGEFGLEVSP